MILANVAAAQTCERARTPHVYRVHDEPTQEKLNALREFLQTLDISLPKSGSLRPDLFNRILAQVKGREVERLVNEVVLRSRRPRPSIRLITSAISASLCAVTRYSPRLSAVSRICSCSAP